MADLEVEEDLDYHITFPSPISQEVTEGEDAPSPSATDQDEPVMVLLGWAGCEDKHLSKYSAIHERRCITIRYTAPSADIFYNSGNLRLIAVKILELVIDLQLAENPIFFHIFSNGGCMVYRHISELMHSDPNFMHMRMQGAIFDSCPSNRNPLTAARAIISTSKNMNFVLKYITAFFFVLFLYGTSVLAKIKSKFVGVKKSDQFWDAIKRDPAKCPQLYLYSKADEIVNYISVEDQIRTREAHVKVLKVCWDDSAHVAHLRSHREAYMKQCYDFIDICMGSSS